MKLNAFYLKVIALISMTVDHYGYFIEPDNDLYRIIGRLAFVIFAYMVANAYLHTSNRLKHGLILLGFGLAIDVVLLLTNNYYFSNIFITLAIGYFLIYCYDTKKYLLMIPFLAIPFFINIDYGFYGILLILACYIFFDKIHLLFVTNIALIAIFSHFNELNTIQYYSCLGILLLALYNQERGYKLKYFFYIYYPLHIIIINAMALYLK